jgi:RNA polymerase sigma factor (sigma-70 family)
MQALSSVPRPTEAPSSHDGDFAAWVGTHLRTVWRYLRMHGAAPDVADDLAQEVFVVAWRKGAQALEPAAAVTFLRRTARFLFLRHLRDERHLRQQRPAVELADAVDLLWQQHCHVDGGDGLLAALRECVGQLEGRARRAVELGYGIDAFAPTPRLDVAAELGLKPNGLKTLLQRVRQQLRACIERRQP